ELAREIEHWPQITKNVKAPRRREWKEVTRFSSAVRKAETELGTAGRLVVRASGTEPVLRITVEARDDAVAKRIVEALAAEAAEALA
ncbi:MAG TPA: phosphoglucosamine mutase, partial [Candidatus Limnocylindria bacterium]